MDTIYNVRNHPAFNPAEDMKWDLAAAPRGDDDAPDMKELPLVDPERVADDRPPVAVPLDDLRQFRDFLLATIPKYSFFTVPGGDADLEPWKCYQVLETETRDVIPEHVDAEDVDKWTWLLAPMEIYFGPELASLNGLPRTIHIFGMVEAQYLNIFAVFGSDLSTRGLIRIWESAIERSNNICYKLTNAQPLHWRHSANQSHAAVPSEFLLLVPGCRRCKLASCPGK